MIVYGQKLPDELAGKLDRALSLCSAFRVQAWQISVEGDGKEEGRLEELLAHCESLNLTIANLEQSQQVTPAQIYLVRTTLGASLKRVLQYF